MLQYVVAPRMYSIEPQVKRLQQKSAAECDTHFLLNGLPASEMLGLVDYMGIRDASSRCPGFTSMINGVRRVLGDEAFYGNDLTENRQR